MYSCNKNVGILDVKIHKMLKALGNNELKKSQVISYVF